MRTIPALSVSPAVLAWLANTHHPKILHIFDRVCNLINEQREVISFVTPQIGNGPFNVVVEDRLLFSEHLQVECPTSVLDDQLVVGDLIFYIANAKCWSPRPDWELLHSNRENMIRQLAGFLLPTSQLPITLRTSLAFAVARGDLSVAKSFASQLVGLGAGLTPAGDDFLLGALYANWIIHPHETAKLLAGEVVNMAAPLTTSLSAAWLRSAGRGEAGIRWHEFFSALLHSPLTQIQYTMDRILATGATSGTEALAGFMATFLSYTES